MATNNQKSEMEDPYNTLNEQTLRQDLAVIMPTAQQSPSAVSANLNDDIIDIPTSQDYIDICLSLETAKITECIDMALSNDPKQMRSEICIPSTSKDTTAMTMTMRSMKVGSVVHIPNNTNASNATAINQIHSEIYVPHSTNPFHQYTAMETLVATSNKAEQDHDTTSTSNATAIKQIPSEIYVPHPTNPFLQMTAMETAVTTSTNNAEQDRDCITSRNLQISNEENVNANNDKMTALQNTANDNQLTGQTLDESVIYMTPTVECIDLTISPAKRSIEESLVNSNSNKLNKVKFVIPKPMQIIQSQIHEVFKMDITLDEDVLEMSPGADCLQLALTPATSNIDECLVSSTSNNVNKVLSKIHVPASIKHRPPVPTKILNSTIMKQSTSTRRTAENNSNDDDVIFVSETFDYEYIDLTITSTKVKFTKCSTQINNDDNKLKSQLHVAASSKCRIETTSKIIPSAIVVPDSTTNLAKQRAHSPITFASNNSKTPQQYKRILKRAPFFYTKPLHAVEGGFINLTNIRLSQEIKAIFGLGPNFAHASMPSLCDYIDDLYNTGHDLNPHLYLRQYLIKSYDGILEALNQRPTNANNYLRRALDKVLKFLTLRKDLCLILTEKSNSLVLLELDHCQRELEWYVKKCRREGIYKRITNPEYVYELQQHVYIIYQDLCQILKLNGKLAVEDRQPKPFTANIQQILDNNNKPNRPLPVMQAVLKFSQDRPIICPIFDTRNSYSYGLEQIVCHVLGKTVETYMDDCNVHDITKTAADIRNTILMDGYSFVSLNVIDLYANIDNDMLLKILSYFIKRKEFKAKTSMFPDVLMSILQMRLGDMNLFRHDGRVYRQMQGLQQGASDSWLFAKIFLDSMLALCTDEIYGSSLLAKVYKYNDEMLIYMREDCIPNFIAQFSNLSNLNLKLKQERKHSKGIPVGFEQVYGVSYFMDIEIYRCRNGFQTNLHENETIGCKTSHTLHYLRGNWNFYIIQAHLRRLLERVSNAFLLRELWFLQQKFRSAKFLQVAVKLIKHYLCIYERIMKEPRNLARNPLCKFRDMNERIDILKRYIADNCEESEPWLPYNRNKAQKRSNSEEHTLQLNKKPKIVDIAKDKLQSIVIVKTSNRKRSSDEANSEPKRAKIACFEGKAFKKEAQKERVFK